MHWDELQGYRYARDTLLDTPPRMIPTVIANLRKAAEKHSEEYKRGMLLVLDELSKPNP